MKHGKWFSKAKGNINEGAFPIFPICPWNIIRIVVNIVMEIRETALPVLRYHTTA